MVNSVTEISKKCGVSREEALFYLEGFNWDLNSAMEACRNKTLPTFTDDSSPFLPICLRSASETPSVPPRTTDSLRISNPTEKQVPSLSRDECIRQFNEFIPGTTEEDAIAYLTRFDWDIHEAIGEFMSDRRPTHSQRKSKSHGTSSPRFDPALALKEAAEAFASSQVKESLGLGTNQDTCINTFLGLASGATREEAITYLKSANWEVLQAFNDFLNQNIQESDQEKDKLINTFCEMTGGATQAEAITYLKRFNWALNRAANFYLDHPSHGEFSEKEKHESMPLNLQENRGNQGHLKEGNIGSSSSSSFIADPAETGSSFNEAGLINVHVTGFGTATSQVTNQNVQGSRSPGRNQETSVWKASTETVSMVIDSRGTSNQLPSSPEQPPLNDRVIDSFMKFVGATREDAIACLNRCNGDVKLAVNYYREGYLKEGEIRSSTSSVTADPTKTGSSFKEAGLLNVHVAVSGIAESQVAKNWKPEAVNEDSNTETGPDPLASQEIITLQVTFSDVRNGAEESMTFRSDQTVRDIRNRIQELRPDCNKDYFLMSVEGEIYDDLNTTVQRIHSRGTTKLLQVDS